MNKNPNKKLLYRFSTNNPKEILVYEAEYVPDGQVPRFYNNDTILTYLGRIYYFGGRKTRFSWSSFQVEQVFKGNCINRIGGFPLSKHQVVEHYKSLFQPKK